jgi:hypothetical protein
MIRATAISRPISWPKQPAAASIVAGVVTFDLSVSDYFIVGNTANITGIVVLGLASGYVNDFQVDFRQRRQPTHAIGVLRRVRELAVSLRVPPVTSAVAGVIDTMFFTSAQGDGIFQIRGGDDAFEAPA